MYRLTSITPKRCTAVTGAPARLNRPSDGRALDLLCFKVVEEPASGFSGGGVSARRGWKKASQEVSESGRAVHFGAATISHWKLMQKTTREPNPSDWFRAYLNTV